MQKLAAILFTMALYLLAAIFAMTLWLLGAFASHVQDANHSVKSGHPPYKPGREIAGGAPSAAETEGYFMKSGQPPYKPGC
jgi:anionic cell wall polymer biosynthesis LytR-Cps2A-Psr (LCP) family protein